METIYTEILEQTADSIEALSSEVFACATYQLLDRKNDEIAVKRIGSIMLYKVQNDEVRNTHLLKTNAILDMKWHRLSEKAILGSADSKGEVHFYSISNDHLKEESHLVIDADALCLSIDWFKSKLPDKVAYSLSSGYLALVQLTENGPVLTDTWKAHSLETWIIACDRENENILYSGSDDCLLRMWDLRNGTDRACFTSKQHLMGVCSFQTHPTRDHIFCSGSYDESVVIWDNRCMRTPLSEFPTGGGVWRLKWHPHGQDILLAACMYNGYKIIDYESCLSAPKLKCSYDKHDSLAYGVDWCLDAEPKSSSDSSSAMLASCSFYDKLLTVWRA